MRRPDTGWLIELENLMVLLGVNYLRQQILCTADLTPEMGGFMSRDPEDEREGPVRVCRDFGAMYDSAAYNWFSWLRYAKAHNITCKSHADRVRVLAHSCCSRS